MVDKSDRQRQRRRSQSSQSGTNVKKRTPLEQAIAEETNRRVRYEKNLRERGLKKTTMWTREDTLLALQALNRLMVSEDGEQIAQRFREFVSQQGAGA